MNHTTDQWRTASLIVGPLLFVAIWLILTTVWLPRQLYHKPRCLAYAAASGRTLLEYRPRVRLRSGRIRPAACVMADGTITFAAMTAAFPPTRMSYWLFERDLYYALMWLTLLVIVLFAYRWLKRQEIRQRP